MISVFPLYLESLNKNQFELVLGIGLIKFLVKRVRLEKNSLFGYFDGLSKWDSILLLIEYSKWEFHKKTLSLCGCVARLFSEHGKVSG